MDFDPSPFFHAQRRLIDHIGIASPPRLTDLWGRWGPKVARDVGFVEKK